MALVALITGASSGIGRELSFEFARHGYDLVLVARDSAKLDSLAKQISDECRVKVQVFVQDLSLPSAPAAVLSFTQSRKLSVDVLVNNAGFGLMGNFSEMDLDAQLNMIDLNVRSLVALTHAFLPSMREKKNGRILLVASTAAFQPGPFMAVYYASKSFVLSFGEALSDELKGSGVSVTVLCPGPTLTGFQSRARMEGTGLFRHFAMPAEAVAQAGFEGTLQGKRVVVPGFLNWLGTGMVKFVPKGMLLKMVRGLHGKGR